MASVSIGGAGQVAWSAGGTCVPRRELVRYVGSSRVFQTLKRTSAISDCVEL